jgi:hypothetical protein
VRLPLVPPGSGRLIPATPAGVLAVRPVSLRPGRTAGCPQITGIAVVCGCVRPRCSGARCPPGDRDPTVRRFHDGSGTGGRSQSRGDPHLPAHPSMGTGPPGGVLHRRVRLRARRADLTPRRDRRRPPRARWPRGGEPRVRRGGARPPGPGACAGRGPSDRPGRVAARQGVPRVTRPVARGAGRRLGSVRGRVDRALPRRLRARMGPGRRGGRDGRCTPQRAGDPSRPARRRARAAALGGDRRCRASRLAGRCARRVAARVEGASADRDERAPGP